ncbi:putative ribosome biogenesis GTPase RsgA [Pilimelia terevasa]|uniref:Small ribosomal subunit biogenesis GTPase RsgA n=1 Tax=Pilimelia terevasa TaxID=53372 RepID=A0A8J3FG63_9ACTN|nr:ribosome small subunit-dependent GTPase A [Pilimelia terevasa]GGK23798.1 putative ribosome biogenesis GTPase RsgA [Pilimelia terevasa]
MTIDLASLGWDATLASALAADPDLTPGRVTRADQGVCTVLTAAGVLRVSLGGGLLAAAGEDPVQLPCAGDWLGVRAWPDGRRTADLLLPRRTAVVRRTSDKAATGQVLAANLDAAAVVEPMDPTPDLGRIERLLALAWESGATPAVVLTKADAVADPGAIVAQVADLAPGVAVHAVSARDGSGLDALRPLVAPGRTLGLLGPSGAGKSTLVNALAGVSAMEVQQVRRVDGKGRHTTTYRALVPVAGGGAIVDTPGIRAVGMFDNADGVDRTFAEVVELVAQCRFADCGHAAEPGCAVRAALESGDLSRRRFDSWRRLEREVAYEARRRDVRLAAAEKAKWKRVHREQRAHYRHR